MEHSDLLCSFLALVLCSSITLSSADDVPLHDTCPMSTPSQGNIFFFNGYQCKNPNTVKASDFKNTMLNHAGDTDNFLRSSVNVLTATEFPGLNTLGLAVARTDLAMDGMVLPHAHPRASEMMYVLHGTVIAGFVDTKNRLFQKRLGEGDVFVFPRGLLHFCLNAGYGLATAFSVMNSQNPGVVSIAGVMFSPDSDVSERLVARMLDLRAAELGYNTTRF